MLKRAASEVFVQDAARTTSQKKLTLEMLHLDIRCNSDDALLRYLASDCDTSSPGRTPTQQWASLFLNDGTSVTANLGRRLLERRLHRPLVILAGHNLNVRTEKGSQFRCTDDEQKIVEALYEIVMQDDADKTEPRLPQEVKTKRAKDIRLMESELAQSLQGERAEHGPEETHVGGVIFYCLKPKLGYKDPMVLCRWTDGSVRPLSEIRAKGVQEQISAMQENYLALWRLFVFVRPDYLAARNMEDTATVRQRCEDAVDRFLRWAHMYGNNDAQPDDTPNRQLNCLRLDHTMSGLVNSRDIRWAFPIEELLAEDLETPAQVLKLLDDELPERNADRAEWEERIKSTGGKLREIRAVEMAFVDAGITDDKAKLNMIRDIVGTFDHSSVSAARPTQWPALVRERLRQRDGEASPDAEQPD